MVNYTTAVLFALLASLLPSTHPIKNPLVTLQMISRYFRQGNRYDEGPIRDTPAHEITSKEYDFVVVGAGNAGSVMANRLSEESDWKVLLLEAGRDENPFTDVPAVVAALQSTDYNWGYLAEREDDACLGMSGHRCRWPRGKALGGTSTINYMIYTRGNGLDYDKWASDGNTGWSYDDLLPYFKKSENILIPEYLDSPYHQRNGYLNVERIPFSTPLVRAFVESAEEFGYKKVDYNGESQFGFSRIQVNQRNGSRCSANKAFLHPIRHRRNLDISINSHVTKVLIDAQTKRAYGIEFVKDRRLHTVRARKEVILSGGALNSPQLLMLSGVGPKDHLQEFGIPVIKDLKVGHNMQEHVAMWSPIFTVNASVSLIEDRVVSNPKNFADFIFHGRGPFTTIGGAEGIAYVRTPLHGRDGDQRPDIELLFIGTSPAGDSSGAFRAGVGLREDFDDMYLGPIRNRDTFAIVPLLMHPKSRGLLRLKSRDPFKWPVFHANFFSDPQDMEVLVEGIKMAVRVGLSKPFQRYGARVHEPLFDGCGHVRQGSDAYWACLARHFTGTLHHQLGTCKMGPASDPDAVVDPELKVYGVSGLRVVDMSVFPSLPTAHTSAPAYMVGEKGADLVKKTYGRA